LCPGPQLELRLLRIPFLDGIVIAHHQYDQFVEPEILLRGTADIVCGGRMNHFPVFAP
jgi:hypothetical protein